MIKSAAEILASIPDESPKPPHGHGTVAGYSRHRRRGERPCGYCMNADRERKQHGRDAYYLALGDVRDAHPDEFRKALDARRRELGLKPTIGKWSIQH